MKKILLSFFVLISCASFAQTYSSQNITLLSHITPNTSTVGLADDNRGYSGCWGWYQQSTNKEYAIVGTSNGTYFIDVTSPTTPSVSAFVQGRLKCTWREMKTYKNYCYIVSDDSPTNTFQIVDMSALPATVTVVYNSNNMFERGHTIWVDNNKMYVGGVTYKAGSSPQSSPMNVYSLNNPATPVLLRQISDDISSTIFNYVHDMFVRNDTVYASTGWNGLHVLKFDTITNTFSQLGSFTGYQSSGYNHSSSLTKNGKYLMFCDEDPASLPIHMVDVQNLGNIQPLQTFKPTIGTTPHNPYIVGNDFAIVSCYQDGLMIFDISQPSNLSLAGYFDTYPQGGNNLGDYSNNPYRGNWGNYPYLPSGIIIANDMQNGTFILNASAAYTNTVRNPLALQNNASVENKLTVFPNPASNRISVNFNTQHSSQLEIKNIVGHLVFQKNFEGTIREYIDLSSFANGTYFISITENNHTLNQKLIINH